MIKQLIIGAFLFGMISCSNSNKAIDPMQNPQRDILAEERVIGIVHLNEPCGIFITAQVGESQLNLIPNNLDEKFKKEGMKLKFFFLNSSMPIPKGCDAVARGDLKDVNAVR